MRFSAWSKELTGQWSRLHCCQKDRCDDHKFTRGSFITKRSSVIRKTGHATSIYLFLLTLLGLQFSLTTNNMLFNSGVSSSSSSSTWRRNLSINLGGGKCKWTGGVPVQEGDNVYGTLIASYPASGMRVTWQQTAAITGMQVLDDFFNLHLPKIGIVKTQYPHYEGIWSYGANLQQVILLIRNPRWAMPSYHTLISEIGYAHTWELAYSELPNVFSRRPPVEDWTRWRDYRFSDEIQMWGWHIDYFMENGTKYWFDFDFERNGQYPFRFRNETEKPWPKDLHCSDNIDCVPKAAISYENMIDVMKGPTELRKIASVLRGKPGMNVIDDEAIECIWNETWYMAPEPSNSNRDLNGLPRTEYNFTIDQMYAIEDKLEEYVLKYSSEPWDMNPTAADLVTNFENYLIDVRDERLDMEANPRPTPAPNANYPLEIKEWYSSLGKGNRNDMSKIQGMSIWDDVKHFYSDST